ncbi:MAG: FG-GAP-like repeat-containing protein [Sphingomonas bacterium]
MVTPVPEPTSDLVNGINYLLDDILGLDRTNKLIEVAATRSTKDGLITVVFNYGPGAWPDALIDHLPTHLLSFSFDPKKLKEDHGYTVKIQAEIRGKLDGFVADFVGMATEGITGPARGVAEAAGNALKNLLSSELMTSLSETFADSLLNLDLPDRSEIATVFGHGFEELGKKYFEAFIPEIAKTYGKLGLAEIITKATSGLDPSWATAIHSLGHNVLDKVLDNIVTNYFADAKHQIGVLDGVHFSESFGNAIAGLLVNFDALDRKIVDDILGIDGHSWLQTQISDWLNDEINKLVKDGFGKAVDFLAGDFKVEDLKGLFDQFADQFDITSIQHTLGNFLVNYAGTELAKLFVDIDSLPEALISQLGSTILSSALGDALGAIGLDAFAGLFGEVAANALGAAVFNGLGAILGAAIGAVAGSVVFDFIDGLFDGAISGFIGNIIEWIRNDSPQAFYGVAFHPETNSFQYVDGSAYHKDDDGSKILKAVTGMSNVFKDKVNDVIKFIDQPATIDPAFDYITMVWGKKHFDEKFAAFKEGQEGNKIVYSKDATLVVTASIGAVLRHTDFHTGNQIISKAYDEWKADIGASAADNAFVSTTAFQLLQNLIGLARFANDYRQNPDKFDALMASDAPIGVTILQQYLEAEAHGFNAASVLHGKDLPGQDTIGSAAAGDTIYLDGGAWRAVARGGNDTIFAAAMRNQEVDGGTGNDTVVLSKAYSAYTLQILDRDGKQGVITDNATGIKVTVTDVEQFRFSGTTMSFEQAFPNHAPVITSGGGGATAAISVTENGVAVTTVTATDADGDLRAYSISGGADAALFRIDSATGVLTFLTAPNFESPGDADRNNIYDVIVSASDGKGSDTQAIAVRITNLVESATEGNVVIGTAGSDTIGMGAAPPGEPFATAKDDTIFANGGNDTAYGGSGNDGMFGGTGNDLLGGDDGNDLLEGEDGNDTLYGGAGTDVLRGGAGHDFILGDAGDDLLDGGADDDELWGFTGNDSLVGGSGNDKLYGEAGNDRLDGQGGADSMTGGPGDDIYFVDNVGDTITELPGEGTDTVMSNVNFTLVDSAAIETITTFDPAGIAAINLTGNGSSNRIVGNAGSNVLVGNGGDDQLEGNAGSDTLNGGVGTDTVSGGAGIDLLTGGAGNDLFLDTKSGLNGDTIADLAVGDRIVISDAALSGFSFALSGSTLTYSGGSLTLTGGMPGGYHLEAAAYGGGGVQLSLTANVVAVSRAAGDFNGDGRSDIVWRSDSGAFSDWLAKANGGFTANDGAAFQNIPTSWKVAGTGDFNGDGRSDLLWRSDGGQISDWLGRVDGGFTNNDANAFSSVSTSWHVVGAGDFNGDGRDDLVWRSDAGHFSDWLGQANGGFANNDANAFSSIPTNWHVVGTGDFNGDGRGDVLWRDDAGQLSNWLGKANGGFTNNDANAFSSVPTNWHVEGTGDFNGDGRDDLAWRSDAGQVSNWLATASGGWINNDANAYASVPTNWHIEDTGDYNGDGRDDILWRSDTGQLSDWLATASGGWLNNDANAFSSPPPIGISSRSTTG